MKRKEKYSVISECSSMLLAKIAPQEGLLRAFSLFKPRTERLTLHGLFRKMALLIYRFVLAVLAQNIRKSTKKLKKSFDSYS